MRPEHPWAPKQESLRYQRNSPLFQEHHPCPVVLVLRAQPSLLLPLPVPVELRDTAHTAHPAGHSVLRARHGD